MPNFILKSSKRDHMGLKQRKILFLKHQNAILRNLSTPDFILKLSKHDRMVLKQS